MPVVYVRTELTADASFAAIFERRRFGMAMAAMIKMMATTINNSIKENPPWQLALCPAAVRFFPWEDIAVLLSL
jgi:hypothetical protein